MTLVGFIACGFWQPARDGCRVCFGTLPAIVPARAEVVERRADHAVSVLRTPGTMWHVVQPYWGDELFAAVGIAAGRRAAFRLAG